MKMYINMFVFTILMTWAMSMGSMVGIIICGIGFLMMMIFIEDLEDAEHNTKLYELQRKIEQETSWQNKKVNQEELDTNQLTNEPNKADTKKQQA